MNYSGSNFIYGIDISVNDGEVLLVQLYISIRHMALQNLLSLHIPVNVQKQNGRDHNQKQQDKLLFDVQLQNRPNQPRQHRDAPPGSITISK
ncbi:hypothetical protein D3C75_786160 [compost metagenome]